MASQKGVYIIFHHLIYAKHKSIIASFFPFIFRKHLAKNNAFTLFLCIESHLHPIILFACFLVNYFSSNNILSPFLLFCSWLVCILFFGCNQIFERNTKHSKSLATTKIIIVIQNCISIPVLFFYPCTLIMNYWNHNIFIMAFYGSIFIYLVIWFIFKIFFIKKNINLYYSAFQHKNKKPIAKNPLTFHPAKWITKHFWFFGIMTLYLHFGFIFAEKNKHVIVEERTQNKISREQNINPEWLLLVSSNERQEVKQLTNLQTMQRKAYLSKSSAIQKERKSNLHWPKTKKFIQTLSNKINHLNYIDNVHFQLLDNILQKNFLIYLDIKELGWLYAKMKMTLSLLDLTPRDESHRAWTIFATTNSIFEKKQITFPGIQTDREGFVISKDFETFLIRLRPNFEPIDGKASLKMYKDLQNITDDLHKTFKKNTVSFPDFQILHAGPHIQMLEEQHYISKYFQIIFNVAPYFFFFIALVLFKTISLSLLSTLSFLLQKFTIHSVFKLFIDIPTLTSMFLEAILLSFVATTLLFFLKHHQHISNAISFFRNCIEKYNIILWGFIGLGLVISFSSHGLHFQPTSTISKTGLITLCILYCFLYIHFIFIFKATKLINNAFARCNTWKRSIYIVPFYIVLLANTHYLSTQEVMTNFTSIPWYFFILPSIATRKFIFFIFGKLKWFSILTHTRKKIHLYKFQTKTITSIATGMISIILLINIHKASRGISFDFQRNRTLPSSHAYNILKDKFDWPSITTYVPYLNSMEQKQSIALLHEFQEQFPTIQHVLGANEFVPQEQFEKWELIELLKNTLDKIEEASLTIPDKSIRKQFQTKIQNIQKYFFLNLTFDLHVHNYQIDYFRNAGNSLYPGPTFFSVDSKLSISTKKRKQHIVEIENLIQKSLWIPLNQYLKENNLEPSDIIIKLRNQELDLKNKDGILRISQKHAYNLQGPLVQFHDECKNLIARINKFLAIAIILFLIIIASFPLQRKKIMHNNAVKKSFQRYFLVIPLTIITFDHVGTGVEWRLFTIEMAPILCIITNVMQKLKMKSIQLKDASTIETYCIAFPFIALLFALTLSKDIPMFDMGSKGLAFLLGVLFLSDIQYFFQKQKLTFFAKRNVPNHACEL